MDAAGKDPIPSMWSFRRLKIKGNRGREYMSAYVYYVLLPLKEYQSALTGLPDKEAKKFLADIDEKGLEFGMKAKFLSDDAADVGDPKKEPKGALCYLFDIKANADKTLAWLHSEEKRLKIDLNVTPYAQEFTDPESGEAVDSVEIETPKA
jgi:hypothetical protein